MTVACAQEGGFSTISVVVPRRKNYRSVNGDVVQNLGHRDLMLGTSARWQFFNEGCSA